MSFVLSPMENNNNNNKTACLCAGMHVCERERAREHLIQVYRNVVMKSILSESESTFWTFHFKLCNGWIYLEQELRGQRQSAPALQQARPCINSGWCTSPGSVWNLVPSQRLEAGNSQSKPFGGKPQLCGCGILSSSQGRVPQITQYCSNKDQF